MIVDLDMFLCLGKRAMMKLIRNYIGNYIQFKSYGNNWPRSIDSWASASIGSVEITLNGTKVGIAKTIKSNLKRKMVVVLDDLERFLGNLYEISLIGYFNELILQGIKYSAF